MEPYVAYKDLSRKGLKVFLRTIQRSRYWDEFTLNLWKHGARGITTYNLTADQLMRCYNLQMHEAETLRNIIQQQLRVDAEREARGRAGLLSQCWIG